MAGKSELESWIGERTGRFEDGLERPRTLDWVLALDEQDEPHFGSFDWLCEVLDGVPKEHQLELIVALCGRELDRQFAEAQRGGVQPERWIVAVSFIPVPADSELSLFPRIFAVPPGNVVVWPPACPAPFTSFGCEVAEALAHLQSFASLGWSRRFVALQEPPAEGPDALPDPRVLLGHLGCEYFRAAASLIERGGDRNLGDPSG